MLEGGARKYNFILVKMVTIFGCIFLLFGLFEGFKQIKKFANAVDDPFSYKFRLLLDGIIFIILGIGMIYQGLFS